MEDDFAFAEVHQFQLREERPPEEEVERVDGGDRGEQVEYRAAPPVVVDPVDSRRSRPVLPFLP